MRARSSRMRSRSTRMLFAIVVLLGLLTVPVPIAWSAAGDTTLVSVASDGTQANGGSFDPSINADGRFVAFYADANNLVLGDTNGAVDIFVHDRETGSTERISINSTGNQANGHSASPEISGDGRFVTFYASATNLVPGDTNGKADVFVRDRQTDTTERVSVSNAGNQGNGDSYLPDISADGRFVVFQSFATNLVPGDTNGPGFQGRDIFVHNRQTHTTTRVSVASSGTQANGPSEVPTISADGRFVAFYSAASNLVPNCCADTFVHDRQTGITEPVSHHSFVPSLSADGRFVAFLSSASDLVPGDTNGAIDIFVLDRQTGTMERISINSSGIQGDGPSFEPDISADGRFVTFSSDARNMAPGLCCELRQLYVHDRQTDITTRVSVDSAGNAADGTNFQPAISGDGRFVTFFSLATNLVPGDTNSYDVFVHEIETIPDEDTSPTCTLIGTGTDPQGRKFIDVRTQDTGSGLGFITVLKQTNASITIPSFTPGTTAPVTVRATKLDQTKPSQVQLRVTDLAGNVTTCDPVDVLVVKEANKPVTTTLTGIPAEEDTLSLTNGTPGVQKLEVTVNGVRFKQQHLSDGEVRAVDLSSAMQPGDGNTVTIRAWGKAGASVYLLLWDGGP